MKDIDFSGKVAVVTGAAMSGMPTALGRAGETHELVDVILFMCSENASFVTGTNRGFRGRYRLTWTGADGNRCEKLVDLE